MVPKISYRPEMGDLFANFLHNWKTIFPAVAVLIGIFFGTFILRKIKELYF